MNLIWSKKLINSNCVATFLYNGIFGIHDSEVIFIYGDTPDIMIAKENNNHDILVQKLSASIESLPRDWMVINKDNTNYLMCDINTCVDINLGSIVEDIPCDISSEYIHRQSMKRNHDTDSFRFDEFIIEHCGNWGYCCKQSENRIWTFNGRAYLYTDIMRFEDNLYFGTAGMGGYFYILNIRTGETVLCLKTGGTAFIETYGGTCYILTCGNAPELLCIDLLTGTILDRLLLPGKSSVDSCIKLINGKIFAVTFYYKGKNQLSYALLNRVDVI